MILEGIELINFRLHKSTSLNFSDRLNYIVGGNGQGKTTILEAIYYLCTSKSLNQSSDNEAVSFGDLYFTIEGEFKNRVSNKVRISYSSETNKKSVLIDDKQMYRISSYIGKFPVVTLTLSDHAHTFGAPSDRRKFVDSVISQSSGTYLDFLLEYNKTLRQRSSLLNRIKETGNASLYKELETWTDILVSSGTELIRRRIDFIKEFNGYLKESYSYIMGDKEIPEIEYSFHGETEKDRIGTLFTEKLSEERNNEIRRGVNLIGPHRDEFYFKINGLDLRRFGSQGQHKTFQISLRFGEFFFLKEKTGRTPIFLMDDVFGELDSSRANKISGYLSEIGQAFVTLTDLANIGFLNYGKGDKKIMVDQGGVTYA